MLKAGGTLTVAISEITAEFDTNTADSITKKLEGAQAGQALDISGSYKKMAAAVTKANDLIGKALKSNDLTELDTTNLKALRSYINETKATFDAALKETGLKGDVSNTQGADVTQEKIDKLKAGLDSATELGEKAKGIVTSSQNQAETATSSKAAMKELLGDDGADGTVGAELDAVGTAITAIKTTIAAAITTAETPPANQQPPTPAPNKADLDVETRVEALTEAVKKATAAIDEKLESGDLTQLDTSNLKALRSSINDIQSQLESTFEDVNIDHTDATTPVPVDKLKELQEAFKAVETSNTELEEKWSRTKYVMRQIQKRRNKKIAYEEAGLVFKPKFC